MNYYGHRGAVAKIKLLSISLKKYIKNKKISDYLSTFLEVIFVTCDYMTADFKLSNDEIDTAHDCYRDAGLSFFNCYILSSSLHHAELKGDVSRVKVLLEKFRDDVSDDSDMDFMYCYYHEAIYSTMIKDMSAAIQYIDQAIERAVKAHTILGETACRSFAAYIYTETEEYDRAIKELEMSILVFKSFNSYSGMVMSSFIRCWMTMMRC